MIMHEDLDNTLYFHKGLSDDMTSRDILRSVYSSLEEKGYDPLNQIVGYLLSGDPAYITSYHNARSLIKQIDRDTFIEDMLVEFIGVARDRRL